MNLIYTLIKKDYLVDSRQKYAIAGIGLYIFSTIYICQLTFNNSITQTTWNALLWIIILFASITAIGKSFNQEENRNLYYYYLVPSKYLLLAKLVYYLIYQFFLVLLTLVLFFIYFKNSIPNHQLFFLNLSLGSIGLAVTFTMISSIAAKSDNSSTMMALLGFPVIIPVLLLAVSNSKQIILGAQWQDIQGNSITLISVIVIIIAVSFIMFPYSRRN